MRNGGLSTIKTRVKTQEFSTCLLLFLLGRDKIYTNEFMKKGTVPIMLENTNYRLNKEKQLCVGYFGGSITEGSGASIWNETSWRARTNAFLHLAYPDAEITEVMAAIGGTGTDLGICRLEKDLLAKKPNLVFIEFATNDLFMPFKDQLANYESCLRRIMEADPTTEIICVFTAQLNTDKAQKETGDYRSRTVEAFLAHYYGLPIIDIGDVMRTAVHHAGDDWTVYTTDTVHPNDDGYLLCANTVREHLTKWLSEKTPASLTEKKLPSPISASLPHGKMVELSECEDALQGWHFVDKPFKKRFPHYYKADGIGSTIDLEFEGSAFGLFWIMDDNSGMIEISLDGGEPVRLSAWDEYCPKFSRAGYTFPFTDLSMGKHKIHLRVCEDKAKESHGNDIAIFAFLSY